ncbi:PAS domain-containing protein [Priestia abyssalis]|uniref:PAS domain-containing protein n=1 Tax=Priestia abyssalis TaxID=1221450 RepID=UPI000994C71B|nr:PAS domain-containing protein [Priestia abyssalis]
MTDFGHYDYRLVAASVLVAIVSSFNMSFYTLGFIMVGLLLGAILHAYFKRNRAIERHRFSEQHFHSLFKYSPFLVLLIDLNGRIINVNPMSKQRTSRSSL